MMKHIYVYFLKVNYRYFTYTQELLCRNFITYMNNVLTWKQQNTWYLVAICFRKHDKNVCQVHYFELIKKWVHQITTIL